MWRRELLKNKIHALLILFLGVASVFVDNDATFLLFALLIGIPLFFSRDNQIFIN